MPRINTSAYVCVRILNLAEALRTAAQQSHQRPEGLSITWTDEQPATVAFKGQMEGLFALMEDLPATPTKKDQLRNDLKVLELVELLEDQRYRTQGSKWWHFTLTLHSRQSTPANDAALIEAISAIRKRPWTRETIEESGLADRWPQPLAS